MCRRPDGPAGRLEVAEVFHHYREAFRNTRTLCAQQHRVMRAIETCRTAELGGHLAQCDRCGAQVLRYHSCRNRHCPKCQTLAKERWVEARCAELLPVPYFHVVFTLPQVFRGKYLDALSQAFERGELRFAGQTTTRAPPKAFALLLATLRAEDWVVYSKRPFAGPEQVVAYLGRYTHRVAISNERLVGFQDGEVQFRWKDYAHGNKTKVMALGAEEFIRRFLLHVLPTGFMRIRHFGLLANRHRAEYLARARQALDAPLPVPRATESVEVFLARVMGLDLHRCPHCQQGRLRLIGSLPPTPKATGPPLPWAA